MKAKVITYLKVEVWSIISQVYQKIGRPIDDISTLINSLDDRVWQLIANGITTTINQCDSDYDKQILKNISHKIYQKWQHM
ncbi:hypothetical protein SD457_07030 [Coprobacillaceae bacterium CR2/5/TPMF4]|nr:hypothetical protein SD457_07030 [Coprobacillaceae bacterium CR2/5/TPMF4]